jgi:hypothetical protein
VGAADARRASLRRWACGTLLGLLLAGLTAVAVGAFLPRGQHVAYFKLYMPANPRGIFYDHPEGGVDFQAFQRTQFALLRSRPVLFAVLRDEKVQQLNLDAMTGGANPVEWLEGQIKVEMPDDRELPRVTMSGDDPEALKVLVSAVVEAYLSEVVHKKTQEHRQQRLERLQGVQATYAGRLKRLKQKERDLAKAAGANKDEFLLLRQQITTQQITQAKQELFKTNGQLRKLEFEVRFYEGKLYVILTDASLKALQDARLPEQVRPVLAKLDALKDKPFDTPDAFSQELAKVLDGGELKLDKGEQNLAQDLVLKHLEAKKKAVTVTDIPEQIVAEYVEKDLEKDLAAQAELEAELAKVRAAATDDGPATERKLRAALEDKRAFIEERRKQLRPIVKARLLEKARSDAHGQVAWMKERIKYNAEHRDALVKEITHLQEEERKFQGDVQDLEDNRFELKHAEAGVQRVGDAIDKLTIEMPAPERVSKWDNEVVVVAPDETPRHRAIGLSAVGAFAAVLLVVGFLDFRARRAR